MIQVSSLNMSAGNALRTHRLLLRLAFSASNAFAWIFIFEYLYLLSNDVGAALVHVALLYALSQTIAILFTPLAARGLRNGMRREMIFAVLAAASAFIFLGASFQGLFGQLTLVVLVGFALLLGLYRALYWIPYQIERHDMQAPSSRLSFEIIIALVPTFIGSLFVLHTIHESWVLFGAASVMILALLPFITIPDVYEGFSWNYRETFGQLIDRAHRRVALGAFFDGIQGAALLLVWPLAIFLMIGRSYELFGLILSFTLLILLILRDIVGRSTRRPHLLRSLPIRVAIVSSAWIGRIFVINPLSIIIADAYLHTGNPKISTDHSAFEQTSDAGHFIDEDTVVREIGLLSGRIFLCLIFAMIMSISSLFIAFGMTFVVAGIAAGVSVIIASTTRQSI